MSENTKTYWRGIEELNNTPEFAAHANNEFADNPDFNLDGGNTYRRDFLKVMGFGIAAATLAACETPVRKAIPYLNKPEDIDPTIPNYYSSTYAEGGDYCSIIVKTREGRPIKIEGNKNSSISGGGLSARVGASVLSLYDKERYRSPKISGKNSTWEDIDTLIITKLQDFALAGKQLRIVTNTILSPSLYSALAGFVAKYPNTKVITYDANSASALLEANKLSFGTTVLPSYDFSKANIIVSLSCDFLGTWFAPVEHSNQYVKGRKLSNTKKQMSRHYQFESILSLTGSNADFRTSIKPSQEGIVVANLYNLLADKAGAPKIEVGELKDINNLSKAANDLWNAKGSSLVVSGSNDTNVQIIINSINTLLGNYGNTLSLGTPSYYKKGDDNTMNSFVDELVSGSISGVIFLNANPVYNHPMGAKIKNAISKLELSVSTADRPDETNVLCTYLTPDHHYLESWSDAEIKKGYFSLGQPTISPLFKTRQILDSILTWSGNTTDAYSYITNYWKNNIYSLQTTYQSFQSFWDNTLHDGVFELKNTNAELSFNFNIASVTESINSNYKAASQDIEYILYEKVGMGTGSQANNPWLQEFPEPVSKACWDNYASVSQKFAKEKDLSQGDIIKIDTKNGQTLNLPVLIQPGQASNTIAIAIGYGREVAGKAAIGVGKNVYPLVNTTDNKSKYFGVVSAITKTSENRTIAQTQTHHTLMGRPVVQESTLKEYLKNPEAGRYKPLIKTNQGDKKPEDITMWKTEGLETHNYKNHAWGLIVDLNSCTGCGSCVISCQAENNIPVVGRQEVINRREMHWIRIDRYYSSDADPEDKSLMGYRNMEDPSDNPKVIFQPVMCQHCNNAPCETVCPVLATTHSTEGLNQMTYNRCVGTRYCSNNCPFKVRRFNWFSYYTNTKFAEINPMMDDLGRMVLNPDVTVRARGVIEKCSMCVQRIQLGKLQAKLERRRPIDGEIETACSQSCPADALVFGDMNDPESRISKALADENKERAYHMLEEINVKPSVSYLTKIRNV
ncbi:MAG: TAT-variant-translocated molybdopterin oxidoreductase [Cytophagales bacterium]|nr:TAT-variant-translocated molybdopterin oxidoreductase [Cytophagales bacterium]